MTEPLTARVFAEGMALLAERFNREISPGMSRIYAGALRDLGAELFVVGVERAVAEATFFPSAKEIRELARPRISAEVRAGEVFSSILAAGQHSGHGRVYSLEAIEAAQGIAAAKAVGAIGGPHRLRMLTDDAFPFVLRDFARAFAEYDAELSARVTIDTLAPGASPRQIQRGTMSPIGDSIAAALPAGILEEPSQ